MIDRDPADSCSRFTIIERGDRLPRFVFHTVNFNVSRILHKSYLVLTIGINVDEFDFVLKFADAHEAAIFHELVTRKPHIDPGIGVSIPQHMNKIIELP